MLLSPAKRKRYLYEMVVKVDFMYDVPAGSPLRGGDVAVYVLDINHPSWPILFILFLCLFLSVWPFQLYYIQ